MDPILELVKQAGPYAGFAVLLLYAIEKTGVGPWLRRAHRATAGQQTKEREILSADWKETLAALRQDLMNERDACDRRLDALEDRHKQCETELREMREVMGERDRVRTILVDEVLELRHALRRHGVALPDGNRLAEMIAAEDQSSGADTP